VTSIQVYPNPFQKDLKIAYSLNHLGPDASIEIDDITGRKILEEKLKNKEDVVTVGDQLKQGVYLLCLHDEGGVIVKRIIKE